MSWKGLIYNHYWLIVIIEAAFHCESRHERYIRYNRLREKSNEALKRLTKGEKIDLGGTFDSIIRSARCKKFLCVRAIKNKNDNRKETRIYPKVRAIQNEVKNRKTENLNHGDDRLVRIRNKYDTVHRVRSLSDSAQVSEKIDVIVTRANPKEASE
ncbi:MAG TPA: hypothetical protein VJ729_08495 [Nitrososphaeraceae archaeon]|nr:hypothetical protein [Nitrososphaeraceae archaeon]